MAISKDRKAIACTLLETISTASIGSPCFVRATTWSDDRVELLVCSRTGRWISKWESLKRVGNFRFETLPPTHPRYDDERLTGYATKETLVRLQGIGDGNSAP